MKQYHALIERILLEENNKSDRTQTGTLSVFGHQMRFDLNAGFPLVTSKKTNFEAIVAELLWFISGSTNITPLQEQGVKIWNQWADEKGNIGNMYGSQWRTHYGRDNVCYDQLAMVIDQIKNIPHSRRHLVSCWDIQNLPDETKTPQENVADGKMALAPCHPFFQFYVSQGKLSCQFYLRSSDVFVGLPFNIGCYALLTHLIAAECNLGIGDLVVTTGDTHIYLNHVKQARELLNAKIYDLPRIVIPEGKRVVDIIKSDIMINDYISGPYVKVDIAV